MLKRHRTWVLWAAAVVAAAHASFAEQPAHHDLTTPVYTVLYHSESVKHEPFEGIWTVDPTSKVFRRLTSFYYFGPQGIIDGSVGASLTASADLLLFQGWPAYLEFDAATMQLQRRIPPSTDQRARGWVLQGPLLTAALAGPLGLRPGVYGFAVCGFYVFTGEFPIGECTRDYVPGSDSTDAFFRAAVMLRSEEGDEEGPWHAVADLRETPEETMLADGIALNPSSYDSVRKGFWLGSVDKVTFLPVRDAALDLAGAVRRTPPPDVFNETRLIETVFYDPESDGFLAVRNNREWPYDKTTLRLDMDLKITDVIATYRGDVATPEPRPLTFARLAPTLPSTFEQTIPIVAHTSGVNGTYWTSDLWLYNPSASATTVTVRRVAAPGVTRTVELGPHASWHITDALAWVGGGPTGDHVLHDALVLTTPYRWGEQVVATSRTSTPSVDPAERARGGAFGQAVTALPTRLGHTNHLVALDPYLSVVTTGRPSLLTLDRRDPARFRHNLGVVNDADDPLTVTLRWAYDPYKAYDPHPEGSLQNVTIAPHTVQIINIESLFPAAYRDAWPPRIAVAATRPAILFLSMVDNTTGDGTMVPFTNLFLLGDDETRFAVPVVGHLPGENGTFWTTDFYGAFWDDHNYWEGQIDEVRIKAVFHPVSPTTNCGGAAQTAEIGAYLDGTVGMPLEKWIKTRTYPGYPPPSREQVLYLWRTVFPDVVHLFGPCASDEAVRGALEVRTGSWMAGYTRTYTTRSDGGTYGEMLPLYPPHGWPVQHFAGIEIAPAFRINLGLYNGDKEHAITHRLMLYTANSTLAAQREIVMQPWQSKQERLETMLGIPVGSLATGTYGLTVLPLDDPEHGIQGRAWAYVSVVDNVTGDPTNWW